MSNPTHHFRPNLYFHDSSTQPLDLLSTCIPFTLLIYEAVSVFRVYWLFEDGFGEVFPF